MKRERAALVCAGGVSRSFVARMPSLLGSLSAIKAGSFRVARRIANSLRAGEPVEDYAALSPCDVIWVALPDAALEQALRDIAAERALAGRVIVLCDTPRESRSGALHQASLNAVGPEERTLVAEGHARALRYLRRIAAIEKRKLIEIPPGSKTLFIAGIHLVTDIALAWIAAAVESLRAAGFSRADATRVVEELGTRTLRAYVKAGRKAWRPSAASELRRAMETKIADPRLNQLYRDGAERAIRFFESPVDMRQPRQ